MRKMRVNSRQLVFLSKGHSGNFQREGMLRVGPNQTGLSERFCRLRGNLLFIMKKQGSDPVEVLVLERCDVVEVPNNNKQLMIRFENGDPSLYVGVSSPQECASWMVALGTANTESLSRRIAHLRTLIHTHSHKHTEHTHSHKHTEHTPHTAVWYKHDTHTTTSCTEDNGNAGGDNPAAKVSPLDLSLECRGLVTVATRVQVQVSVVDENTHSLKHYCCTETVEACREAVFLTGVCFPVDYPLFLHTRIKLTLFSIKDHSTRSFRGFTSFSMRDVFRSNKPHIALSLRTMDGVNEVGEVKVARLHMEGEREDTNPTPGPQDTMVCDSLHGSVPDKENSPMMSALLRSSVCKVYRFQTEDHRWMLVREQMSETPLSFSLPKQLLALLIQQDMKRVQDVIELGNLSPHWEGLRREVICHCSYLIGCYQQTLTELNSYSVSSGCFKSSSLKTGGNLQFIPTNLHSQRMQVCDSTHSSGVWYDVITVGAPAYHSQAFKHGGLQRLVNKHTQHCNSAVSYSPEEVSRARELLASVAQLQPLVFGLSEELLGVCVELNPDLLQDTVDGLTHKTEEFVHALKDELVQSALASLHSLCPAHCHRNNGHAPVATGNGTLRGHSTANQDAPSSPWQQEASCHDVAYDEEEWDRVWANVAKSLNCIIDMADRLREREPRPQEVTSLEQPESPGDTNSPDTASSWQEQLLPLVVTLRECVREAVLKARAAMNFVLLQEALEATVSQGTPQLRQRRDAVFSQALSAVVCGFLLKLYGGLEDCVFLQQLHTVGLVVQFEGLLSTYGEELGMLEDMSVGVSDLRTVTFTITNAESNQSADLLPTLTGTRGHFVVEVPLPPETYSSLPQELQEGCVLKIQPVLFNIGINQQQSLAERFGDSSLQDRINHKSCELLKNYCSELREKLPQTADLGSVSEQLWSLERSLNSRKRKNVEVLWNAASLCRRLKAVRLTSCKSAKDRTSMSVTLEQCVILRDQHTLSNAHFYTALDCMRREGSRMENVEKNTGNRKYAFNSVQLLTFPKHYRPPDGTYGKGDT